MWRRVLLVILSVICLWDNADGARILCAFPTPSRSHTVVASALLKGLAERGHQVTMLSSFPLDKPVKNYRDVTVKIDHHFEEHIAKLTKNAGTEDDLIGGLSTLMNNGLLAADMSFRSKEFQKLLKEESFDLVIVGMFTNNFLVGLGAHFKCPIVVLSTVQQVGFSNAFVGNPLAITSVPHVLLGNVATMDFRHRLKNFFVHTAEKLAMTYIGFKEKSYYNAHFPSPNYPKYETMLKNISLVLVNHHFSIGVPRPNVPAMVEVGGLHIKPKPSPLPEKIQMVMDAGEETGVIYFSLGSNVKTSYLPEGRLNQILRAFAKLNQKVLFKWENETLPNQPKNVKTSKWFPQNDVLAHPNVKLFITHGGSGSMLEAQYHGVPVVGIPIYGDQLSNLETAHHEGWAEICHMFELTEKIFLETINKVLNDDKYKKNAMKYSELLKDQPMSPLDTSIYWIEYVMRHEGAKHMQSPTVNQSFVVANSVDSIIFVIILLLASYKLGSSFLVIVFNNMKEKYATKPEPKKTK